MGHKESDCFRKKKALSQTNNVSEVGQVNNKQSKNQQNLNSTCTISSIQSSENPQDKIGDNNNASFHELIQSMKKSKYISSCVIENPDGGRKGLLSVLASIDNKNINTNKNRNRCENIVFC